MEPRTRLTLTRRAVLVGGAALLAPWRVAAQNAPLLLRAAEGELKAGADSPAVRAPMFNAGGCGPVLKLARGEPFPVRIENALDFPFVFATQGLRGTPLEGAATAIAPGESRTLTITPPDAGTFLYRAYTETAGSAARTVLLNGPLIVSAGGPAVADQDILVALTTLALPGPSPEKPSRRVVLVNGAPDLAIKSRPGERLRLRVVNMAAEGMAALRLPAGVRIAALDGQPCAPFAPVEGLLLLAPLGRADLLLDVPRTGSGAMTLLDDMEPGRVLVRVTPADDPVSSRELPDALPDNDHLPKAMPFQGAVRASLTTDAAAVPPVKAKRGQTIILSVDNTSAELYALRLDGHTARLLDTLDDGWKPWWQDTLLLYPGTPTRLAFIAERPGRFAVTIIPLERETPVTTAWIEIA